MYLSLGTLTDLEVEIDELALRNTESNKELETSPILIS